ncbi:MAG: rod-binding protein [Spirochaetota bacterium]|nr:MAG: rod-binding protein [Spirochaetota bacterium]
MIDILSRGDILLDSVRSNIPVQKASEQKTQFDQIIKAKIEEGDKKDKKLLDACYEMETLFIDNMLKSMRKTILETNFFGKSLAKDIFRDMLYSEYAKIMAKTDQFGLAHDIYEQLSVQKTL